MCINDRKWQIKGIAALEIGPIPSVSYMTLKPLNMTTDFETWLLLGLLVATPRLLFLTSLEVLSHLPLP